MIDFISYETFTVKKIKRIWDRNQLYLIENQEANEPFRILKDGWSEEKSRQYLNGIFFRDFFEANHFMMVETNTEDEQNWFFICDGLKRLSAIFSLLQNQIVLNEKVFSEFGTQSQTQVLRHRLPFILIQWDGVDKPDLINFVTNQKKFRSEFML